MMSVLSPHSRPVTLLGQVYYIRLTLASLAEISRILEASGPQKLAILWKLGRDKDTIKHARILLAAMLRSSECEAADQLSQTVSLRELNGAIQAIADLFQEAFEEAFNRG